MRRYAKRGLIASLAILGIGLAFAIGSAVIAGDWWLAQRPWIEIGMRLSALGLLASALFGGLRVSVEPVGWWRLAAIPSAIVVASFWLFAFTIGLPTTGGTETDVVVILYSIPQLFAILVLATVEIAAIPIIVRWWRGGAPEDADKDEDRAPANA
jgi:hypothetical protein